MKFAKINNKKLLKINMENIKKSSIEYYPIDVFNLDKPQYDLNDAMLYLLCLETVWSSKLLSF